MSQNPNLNPLHISKKEGELEVKYLKIPREKKENQKPISAKDEPFLKLPSKTTIRKTMPPPFIDKESIFKLNNEALPPKPTFNKPAFINPDVIAIKKKIVIPPIDIDKIKNPSYINYYQMVREKIRRAAYQNYTRIEEGEVYLSFIISSDGGLKEVRLIEEKSFPAPYLKEIALRSIKDASPFKNFSPELDYPQLSFNVVISFEIE